MFKTNTPCVHSLTPRPQQNKIECILWTRWMIFSLSKCALKLVRESNEPKCKNKSFDKMCQFQHSTQKKGNQCAVLNRMKIVNGAMFSGFVRFCHFALQFQWKMCCCGRVSTSAIHVFFTFKCFPFGFANWLCYWSENCE